jgi:hypothetical protein
VAALLGPRLAATVALEALVCTGACAGLVLAGGLTSALGSSHISKTSELVRHEKARPVPEHGRELVSLFGPPSAATIPQPEPFGWVWVTRAIIRMESLEHATIFVFVLSSLPHTGSTITRQIVDMHSYS